MTPSSLTLEMSKWENGIDYMSTYISHNSPEWWLAIKVNWDIFIQCTGAGLEAYIDDVRAGGEGVV